MHVCAHEWLTWTISRIPVELLWLPIFWGEGEVLISLFKNLPLFSERNLFNKSVSCEGEEWLFPSPHPEMSPSDRKRRLVWGSGDRREKSGSLAVYGAAREAVRTLHLTAPLSELARNPRTTALCHLEPWRTLIMPSRPAMCDKTQVPVVKAHTAQTASS